MADELKLKRLEEQEPFRLQYGPVQRAIGRYIDPSVTLESLRDQLVESAKGGLLTAIDVYSMAPLFLEERYQKVYVSLMLTEDMPERLKTHNWLIAGLLDQEKPTSMQPVTNPVATPANPDYERTYVPNFLRDTGSVIAVLDVPLFPPLKVFATIGAANFGRLELPAIDQPASRGAASRTSVITCSRVIPRAFIVSGIWFSTSGVQT